ncbi:hypothetical protein ACIQF6_27765 [Kitasatospora sp. NPDC092948]|uniref:hypothetical protein n=1 Tax=Kitasatospora sp. NPDC092948 TaxID=3364088 RepID=UPI0038272B85
MRTNHAKRLRRSDTPRRRWGRPGALAAGGVLAVQLLGLALGAADAHATGAGAATAHPRILGPGSPADETALLGGTGPALTGAVGELGAVLEQHLRNGELPLPGQHADGPDAFAIATRLLSGVPQQSRTEDRASRSGPTEGRPAARVPAPAAPADPAQDQATPLPSRRHVDNLTTSPDRLPPPPAPTPGNDAPLAPLAATPADPDDGDSTAAVLLPIAAGLLLTAAATYKHRGLPGGH